MFLIRNGPFAICTVDSALIPTLYQKAKRRGPFQNSRFPDQKGGLRRIDTTPPKILFGFTTADGSDQ